MEHFIDKKVPTKKTTNGCGVDVAVTRADDLDRQLIKYVASQTSPSVLDLACGAGGQSARLAKVGGRVTGVDVHDYAQTFAVLRRQNNLSVESLQFLLGDMTELSTVVGGGKFMTCSCQRALHYLPYQAAQQTLVALRKVVTDRLYISVTGLETAIGLNYPDKAKSVTERFCRLTAEAAATFNIREPLCLYTQSEFEDILEKSGWYIRDSWVSAFGNIKVVCD